jgi:hypothetical protein
MRDRLDVRGLAGEFSEHGCGQRVREREHRVQVRWPPPGTASGLRSGLCCAWRAGAVLVGIEGSHQARKALDRFSSDK